MKIMISYQVDTVDEAKAILDAVDTKGELTTCRVQGDKDWVMEKAVTGPTLVKNEPDAKSQISRAMLDAMPIARKNVSPGAPNITKIGAKSTQEIIYALSHGLQVPERFTEHLKLLWSRGEVKFDGTDYYL